MISKSENKKAIALPEGFPMRTVVIDGYPYSVPKYIAFNRPKKSRGRWRITYNGDVIYIPTEGDLDAALLYSIDQLAKLYIGSVAKSSLNHRKLKLPSLVTVQITDTISIKVPVGISVKKKRKRDMFYYYALAVNVPANIIYKDNDIKCRVYHIYVSEEKNVTQELFDIALTKAISIRNKSLVVAKERHKLRF